MVSINRYPLHSQSAPGSHLHSTMVSINRPRRRYRQGQGDIYIPLWYLLIIDPGADDFCAYPFTFHYGIY